MPFKLTESVEIPFDIYEQLGATSSVNTSGWMCPNKLDNELG